MRVPSILLLSLASSLSVFGMAIIVPSMNSITEAFSADFASVQLVLSVYLIGLAISQPVTGLLCDRFGRRPVMLWGFLVFALASLLCAYAESLPALVLYRFLQAAGVSVGTVATRAILRDTRDEQEMAIALSYVAVAMGVAPIIAPIVGGIFDNSFGYRINFLSSAALGAAVGVAMQRNLRETRQQIDTKRTFVQLYRDYRRLLGSANFMGYTLLSGFIQGSFYSFLAVGAILFEKKFGVDSATFGMMWGLLAMAYVGGAIAGAWLTYRRGTTAVMAVSVWATVGAGASFLLHATSDVTDPVSIMIGLALLMVFAGSGNPGAMAAAVQDHAENAGMATGLSSAIALLIGGVFTIVSGMVFDGSLSPVSKLMFVATCATLASWLLTDRQRIKAA